MPLRPGQVEALAKWEQALERGDRSELVVVPVGYGKTVIGAGSFAVANRVSGADLCLYLTPTDVLRRQVYSGFERAAAMAGSGIAIRKILADNASAHRILATNATVVVATYQQLASSPGPYQRICATRRVHLVCDEAHHLGESGRWAEAAGSLPTASRLLLSATPVRLDRDAILGARYTKDADGSWAIEPLFEVSMRRAWQEGRILKHLNLQMKAYEVELANEDGEHFTFTASEMAELPAFDQACIRDQLRWNEDYVAPLVREFAQALLAKRSMGGRHQGLVFAATTEHANHLYRVFGRHHPSLRCVVVHSGDISDAENDRRMLDFHGGRYDVLIQVRKASEGFDAPAVSALLKLDAVFSREPVIQQLGRGLRYNHDLPEAENVLNVFIGRDPRFFPILEFLEREQRPRIALRGRPEAGEHALPAGDDRDEGPDDDDDADRNAPPRVVDVEEAGDAYVDHTGRFVEGQQLTLFGVPTRGPAPAAAMTAEVVDLDAELRDAIQSCTEWTNRLARERSRRGGGRGNQHQAINAEYIRASGKRGALATPQEYRAKGEWMKARYLELLGQA
jgi:superfamily II DNA or RNA helicase